jgi:hypothetical protein
MKEKKIIEDLVKMGKIVNVMGIICAISLVILGAASAEAVSQEGGSGLSIFISYLIMAVSVYISGYVVNLVLNWRAAMLKHTMKK